MLKTNPFKLKDRGRNKIVALVFIAILSILTTSLFVHRVMAAIKWVATRYDTDGDGDNDLTVWEEQETQPTPQPTGKYQVDRDGDTKQEGDIQHTGVESFGTWTETIDGVQWRIIEFQLDSTKHTYKFRDINSDKDTRDTGEGHKLVGIEWKPLIFSRSGDGGIVIPVDKFGLLAPYIGLASTMIVATVATTIYAKRVKRRKEKR